MSVKCFQWTSLKRLLYVIWMSLERPRKVLWLLNHSSHLPIMVVVEIDVSSCNYWTLCVIYKKCSFFSLCHVLKKMIWIVTNKRALHSLTSISINKDCSHWSAVSYGSLKGDDGQHPRYFVCILWLIQY